MISTSLESNLQDLLGEETRTWGKLKVYAQRKCDSAKPEAGDRAKGGQTLILAEEFSLFTGLMPEMPHSKRSRHWRAASL